MVCHSQQPLQGVPEMDAAYTPGSGSSANVVNSGDSERFIFFGNFGSNIGVIDHDTSLVTNTDISPAAVGTKLVQPLSVNPAYIGNILAWIEDDEDLFQTEDEGATWTSVRTDAGLVTVLQDMNVLFKGNFQNHNIYFVGDGASGVKVYESLDEGITLTALENATLNTAADVVGITVVGA